VVIDLSFVCKIVLEEVTDHRYIYVHKLLPLTAIHHSVRVRKISYVRERSSQPRVYTSRVSIVITRCGTVCVEWGFSLMSQRGLEQWLREPCLMSTAVSLSFG
jgi:hypothetical protein